MFRRCRPAAAALERRKRMQRSGIPAPEGSSPGRQNRRERPFGRWQGHYEIPDDKALYDRHKLRWQNWGMRYLIYQKLTWAKKWAPRRKASKSKSWTESLHRYGFQTQISSFWKFNTWLVPGEDVSRVATIRHNHGPIPFEACKQPSSFCPGT